MKASIRLTVHRNGCLTWSFSKALMECEPILKGAQAPVWRCLRRDAPGEGSILRSDWKAELTTKKLENRRPEVQVRPRLAAFPHSERGRRASDHIRHPLFAGAGGKSIFLEVVAHDRRLLWVVGPAGSPSSQGHLPRDTHGSTKPSAVTDYSELKARGTALKLQSCVARWL